MMRQIVDGHLLRNASFKDRCDESRYEFLVCGGHGESRFSENGMCISYNSTAQRFILFPSLLSKSGNTALSGVAAVSIRHMWRVLHGRIGHFPPGRMHHAGTLAV